MPGGPAELLHKVVHAVRVRWFALRLRRVRVAPGAPVELLGTEYGAWGVPDGLVRPGWTAWCVGAGSDTSFEEALLERFDLREVRSFDPFPRFAELAAPRVDADPRWTFHAVAITAQDGPVTMTGRQDDVMGAVSAAADLHRGEAFVRPGRSLSSIAAEVGTERVELLKLDVEGIEYDLVPDLDLEGLGVVQLSIELHENGGPRRALALLAGLERRGYRVIGRRRRADFNLLHVDALERLVPRAAS